MDVERRDPSLAGQRGTPDERDVEELGEGGVGENVDAGVERESRHPGALDVRDDGEPTLARARR